MNSLQSLAKFGAQLPAVVADASKFVSDLRLRVGALLARPLTATLLTATLLTAGLLTSLLTALLALTRLLLVLTTLLLA